jgi:hypothetical protein
MAILTYKEFCEMAVQPGHGNTRTNAAKRLRAAFARNTKQMQKEKDIATLIRLLNRQAYIQFNLTSNIKSCT